MATITVPVNSRAFIKSGPTPTSEIAGEDLEVMIPLYRKSADQLLYTANSVATLKETSTVVGLTLSISETSGQILVASGRGAVVDFGVALTKGATYYLVGSGLIGLYSDITVGHQIVRVGFANESQDLIVDIYDYNEVKT